MPMSIEKLQQLAALLKEYAAEQESIRLPKLADEVRNIAECVGQDIEVLIDKEEYEERYDRDNERNTLANLGMCEADFR